MVDAILPEPVQLDQPLSQSPIKPPKLPHRSRWSLSILLTIVIVSFLGLVGGVIYNYVINHHQDNTRRQDLSYIAAQAEDFYNFNHFYPTLSQINSLSFSALSPTGIKKVDFKDPSGTSEKLSAKAAPTGYAYQTSPAYCNNLSLKCSHYRLVAILSSNDKYVVYSHH